MLKILPSNLLTPVIDNRLNPVLKTIFSINILIEKII